MNNRNKVNLSVKELLLTPFMIIPLLAYRKSTYRDRLEKDVDRFWSIHFGHLPDSYDKGIIRELVKCPEFRNLFYFRLGRIGRILSRLSLFFLPKMLLLRFGIRREDLGGGLFIQHGFNTGITAEKIGENCWLNQNVTMGWEKDGKPTLGNNVRLATYSIVLGKIHIGDNVTIGAGTTVVRDVPANTLVVSQKPRYIPKENK